MSLMDLHELWRLIGILDMLVVMVSLAYLHMGYRHQMPPVLYRAGWAFGFVSFLVMVGLVANWLSPFPPTPGAKIFAVGASFAAVFVAFETFHSAHPLGFVARLHDRFGWH